MTYQDLTDDQKADVTRYELFLRGLFSSLAGLAKQSDAASWNTFAVANVDSVLASLPPDDVVPNHSGLGGAKDLTVTELQTLQVIARQLDGLLEANRALLVKAIGVNA